MDGRTTRWNADRRGKRRMWRSVYRAIAHETRSGSDPLTQPAARYLVDADQHRLTRLPPRGAVLHEIGSDFVALSTASRTTRNCLRTISAHFAILRPESDA